MALEHASPLQPIRLHPDGTLPPDAVSVSLIKSAELQLLRVVLRAGGVLPAHWVAGECTIQCLTGRAQLVTPDKNIPLESGDVVLVPKQHPHELRSPDGDSALLVTIRLGT
ncbi:cupin domain-containing protein [Azohydromonas caseinilytica]|uniref:Cupin domain-containing protein n=1 Tax=Azohydromonas caseinilytica TaxID=2728836 RepID=A0A848FAB0_9BURK|nr:cupin domain-containing protein [Azohydromonas caseinilytica]NML15263.1 cupin domain-containing protein [Azohydromonas caseinilytica]